MNAEINNLLKIADRYSKAKGLTMSTVGRKIGGTGIFFINLQNGASLTVRKYNDVMASFSREWPDDLAWPEDIPRPEQDQESGANSIQEQERV